MHSPYYGDMQRGKTYLRAACVLLLLVAAVFNVFALSGHLRIDSRIEFVTISNSLTLLIVGLSLAWGSLALGTISAPMAFTKKDRFVVVLLALTSLVWLALSFFNWWDSPWMRWLAK
jgi:hypothetical protein